MVSFAASEFFLKDISMRTIIRSIKSSLPLLLAAIIATFLLAESVPFGLKTGIWLVAAMHFTLCFWFHRRNESEAATLAEAPSQHADIILPSSPNNPTLVEQHPISESNSDFNGALYSNPSASIFGSGEGAQDWPSPSAVNSSEPCSAKLNTKTTSA